MRHDTRLAGRGADLFLRMQLVPPLRRRLRHGMPQLLRRARAAATEVDKAVMKTIGLIGGMSWQSTRIYYDLLNELVAARLGGLHSAEILMRSVDFAGLEAAMRRGDWGAIQSRLGE